MAEPSASQADLYRTCRLNDDIALIIRKLERILLVLAGRLLVEGFRDRLVDAFGAGQDDLLHREHLLATLLELGQDPLGLFFAELTEQAFELLFGVFQLSDRVVLLAAGLFVLAVIDFLLGLLLALIPFLNLLLGDLDVILRPARRRRRTRRRGHPWPTATANSDDGGIGLAEPSPLAWLCPLLLGPAFACGLAGGRRTGLAFARLGLARLAVSIPLAALGLGTLGRLARLGLTGAGLRIARLRIARLPDRRPSPGPDRPACPLFGSPAFGIARLGIAGLRVSTLAAFLPGRPVEETCPTSTSPFLTSLPFLSSPALAWAVVRTFFAAVFGVRPSRSRCRRPDLARLLRVLSSRRRPSPGRDCFPCPTCRRTYPPICRPTCRPTSRRRPSPGPRCRRSCRSASSAPLRILLVRPCRRAWRGGDIDRSSSLTSFWIFFSSAFSVLLVLRQALDRFLDSGSFLELLDHRLEYPSADRLASTCRAGVFPQHRDDRLRKWSATLRTRCIVGALMSVVE